MRIPNHIVFEAIRAVLTSEACINKAVRSVQTAFHVDPVRPWFSSLQVRHRENISMAAHQLEQLAALQLEDVDNGQINNAKALLEKWRVLSEQTFIFCTKNTEQARCKALKLATEEGSGQIAKLRKVLASLKKQIEWESGEVVVAAKSVQCAEGIAAASRAIAEHADELFKAASDAGTRYFKLES